VGGQTWQYRKILGIFRFKPLFGQSTLTNPTEVAEQV